MLQANYYVEDCRGTVLDTEVRASGCSLSGLGLKGWRKLSAVSSHVEREAEVVVMSVTGFLPDMNDGSTWRFMGSYKWGFTSRNMGYKCS